MDIFAPIEQEDLSHWEEVTHDWLPAWAYTNNELREIGINCVRFDKDGYTMLEWIEVSNFFDKEKDIL